MLNDEELQVGIDPPANGGGRGLCFRLDGRNVGEEKSGKLQGEERGVEPHPSPKPPAAAGQQNFERKYRAEHEVYYWPHTSPVQADEQLNQWFGPRS